jgi:hypothetical protein
MGELQLSNGGSMTYSGHTGRVLGVSRAGGLLTTSLAYTAVSDLQKLAQIKHESGSTVVSQFDYTCETGSVRNGVSAKRGQAKRGQAKRGQRNGVRVQLLDKSAPLVK